MTYVIRWEYLVLYGAEAFTQSHDDTLDATIAGVSLEDLRFVTGDQESG